MLNWHCTNWTQVGRHVTARKISKYVFETKRVRVFYFIYLRCLRPYILFVCYSKKHTQHYEVVQLHQSTRRKPIHNIRSGRKSAGYLNVHSVPESLARLSAIRARVSSSGTSRTHTFIMLHNFSIFMSHTHNTGIEIKCLAMRVS